MPTLIVKNKLYISVKEVMSLLIDFRNDMENKRQECLTDINNADLREEIKEMGRTITNLDFDMFIECLDSNVANYRKRLEECAIEYGKKRGLK